MFRRLFRALRHFLGATILVIGSVCLVEVVIGVRHASRVSEDRAETFAELAVPSAVAFQVMRPLAKLQTENGLLETNSYGLRGPEPIVPKPTGTFRVLVLGDEAALAPHLAIEETVCSQLQAILKNKTSLPVEVINGGQPGACPLTLSLLYSHQLVSLNADAVVLMLSADDVADDVRYRAFVRTDETRQPIACPHPSLGGREKTLDVWRSEFRLVDWAASAGLQHWVDRGTRIRADMLCANRRAEWLTAPTGVWAAPLATSLEPVLQLKNRVEADYGQFLLTVAPDVTALDQSPPALAAGWNVVMQFAADNGITMLDPTRQFTFSQTPGQFYQTAVAVEVGDGALPAACAVPLSADGHKVLAYGLAVEIATLPGVGVAGQDSTPTR